MTIERIVAALLILAVLMASLRLILWQRSRPSAPWRLAALLLLQPLCAGLLFLTLYPPPTPMTGDTLRIATAGTPRLAAATPGAPLVILPEAGDISGDESAPDLATVLRRHPAVGTITVLGEGLAARDLETARRVAIRFTPPPPRPGISHIAPPRGIAPGEAFRVGGQLTALPRATIDLLDPAGRVTDSATPDANGHFTLTGTARAAGTTAFTLRVRAGQRVVEEAAVPLLVKDDAAPRLLILAAAPGPEVKYLRRWATDAGFAVTTQMSAGGGIALGDPAIAINGATLRRFDLAIVDDRSWAARRGVLLGAAREGLGLVLRPSGSIDGATRTQWRALGFGIGGGDLAPIALPKVAAPALSSTRLGIGSTDAPVDIATPDDLLPDISHLPLTPAAQAPTLLQDASAAPLAQWRAIGTGRIALFAGVDSYALTLTGHRALHNDWWNALLRTVIRPASGIQQSGLIGWANERLTLCGLSAPTPVERPDGQRSTLLPVQGCAAFWPDSAGWHRTGTGQSFYIYPAQALPAMRAARDRAAMLALRPPAASDSRNDSAPGPSWPFALACLIASALLWLLERARRGRQSAM